MARPPARNPWLNALAAWSAPASRPQDRRAARNRQNAILLLGAAFVLLFAVIIILGLGLIFQPASGSTPVLLPAVQPTAAQSAIVASPMPPGQTKILLLGSDQRPNDNGYRTDTIMLLTIDTDKQTVSVVSFPRDLWVKVPPNDQMKINMVHALGGFKSTAAMFEANFGVKPDYYVLTNFTGFTTFLDSQGGADVKVASDLTDECSLPQRVNSMCSVKAGTVHMDGETALWYVRSRHSSSDFDRLRRAQEVVYAVFKKLVNNITLEKLSQIKNALQNNVETNMPLDKAISFLPVALHILNAPDLIKTFAIDEKQAYPTISWNGMWVLIPYDGAIQDVLRQAGVRP